MRQTLILLMVVWSGFTTLAQPPTPVLYPVTLSAERPAIITFAGDAAARVTITTSAEATLDTTLTLFAPDNTKSAFADDWLAADGSVQRNAQLLDVLLPQTGTYRLQVDSFNGVSVGNVSVEITFANLVFTLEDSLVVSLVKDSAAHVVLDSAGIVTISARDVSGGLDPLLIVRDADGAIVALADDAPADAALNTLDAQMTLAWQVGYLLEVRDFLGRAGAVELTTQEN